MFSVYIKAKFEKLIQSYVIYWLEYLYALTHGGNWVNIIIQKE